MEDIAYKLVTLDRHSIGTYGRYRRHYELNEIVEVEEGSLGIMTFPKIKDAETFKCSFEFHARDIKIIKVKPIGPKNVPCRVCKNPWISSEMKCFYSGKVETYGCKPPDGTVCYPAVEVLT